MDTFGKSNDYIGGFKVLKKIGKAALIIRKNETAEKFVLKISPTIKHNYQYVSRLIFGGSLPFQNELRILKTLNKERYNFLLPIEKSDYKNYYIIPYIENKKIFKECNTETLERIGQITCSIRELPQPQRWWYIKEKVFNYIESSYINTKKILGELEKERKVSFENVIGFIHNSKIKLEEIEPRMIHGDLSDNNLIISSEGCIYIIDWEDARMENFAIFLDLVAVSINYGNLSLNKKILEGFWRNYSPLNDSELNNLKTLLSISYLIFLIKMMKMRRWDDNMKNNVFERIHSYEGNIVTLMNEMEICLPKTNE